MKNVSKYKKLFFPAPNADFAWTENTHLEKPPVFCSVDLRVGNQALVIPMTIEEKLEFFRLLSDTDADPETLDKTAMHRLAEIDLRLDEMLKLLNSGKYTPDQTEIEKITDMVESRLDEQQELLDKLTANIKPR